MPKFHLNNYVAEECGAMIHCRFADLDEHFSSLLEARNAAIERRAHITYRLGRRMRFRELKTLPAGSIVAWPAPASEGASRFVEWVKCTDGLWRYRTSAKPSIDLGGRGRNPQASFVSVPRLD